ncbi:hypothetical protein A2U01_0024650 [Trifolium medium]|uniref:Uncharacterized protein n=1 Tax=Trifolium medium TaxID=97028 RepID=A0A392NWM0_9FABA|nr:hypothetical protein [Trifolium medium]
MELGDLKLKVFSEKSKVWNLRVAQGHMARCAGLSDNSRNPSASCTSRQVVWRVAPFYGFDEELALEGAPLKNSRGRDVMAICALRRTCGAARRNKVL